MTGSEEFGPKHVRLGAALAEVPGHFRAGVDAYARGDLNAGLMHVKHCLIEVLPVVHEELGETHPLVERLARALADAGTAVREEMTVDKINAAFETVNAVGAKCIAAFVGPPSSSVSYRASVVAALLDSMADEYREATQIHEARRVFEYQDARGFLLQAKRMIEALNDQLGAESTAITQHLARLDELVPSYELPKRAALVDEVRSNVESLRSLLASVGGARLEVDPTWDEVVTKLDELVDRVGEHYRSGQAPKAAREASRAFVNLYGAIAAEARARSPELAAELERVLGRDVRVLINDDASTEAVDADLARIRSLLDDLRSAAAGELG